MTAPRIPPAGPGVPSLAARSRDVLASEWTKLGSVRSTYWTLLIAAVAPVGVSAVVAAAFAQGIHKNKLPLADPLLPGFVSLEYAVLAVGVLGVLTFTAEYSTGLIATTFTSVPQRRVVLAAKAAVVGAVTLVLGELACFVSFFLSQAILAHRHDGVSLAHPGAAGAVLAEGTLLCVCALMGLGLGSIIRHTAGAISTLFGVIILPVILVLLPSPWNTRIDRFTLFYAAFQVTNLHPEADLLSPGLSMLVVLAWPAAALLAAAIMITRRPA
jgi:ABC-2 type transport system permease protein